MGQSIDRMSRAISLTTIIIIIIIIVIIIIIIIVIIILLLLLLLLLFLLFYHDHEVFHVLHNQLLTDCLWLLCKGSV